MRIGLKVDVDTLEGYLQGLPSLLRQMESAGVRATFFMSVGPDRSGVAIRRVFAQRGFIGKVLRTRPLNKLSGKNMLYGTLLPAPLIVQADPGIVQAVHEAGHEIGLHAWDHIRWHDRLGRMSSEAVREQLSRAYATLGEIIGEPVRSFAAPGWQCSPASLADHDERALLYASDVRGTGGPFRPRLGCKTFLTPQLPGNLPTLDELWGTEGFSEAAICEQWLNHLGPEINVLTLHTEMEGMALEGLLPQFIDRARRIGAQFGPLRELVVPGPLPTREVGPTRLPGRAGWVWAVR